MMFEAFGFSGVPPTLQTLISATFEQGRFGGCARYRLIPPFFRLSFSHQSLTYLLGIAVGVRGRPCPAAPTYLLY